MPAAFPLFLEGLRVIRDQLAPTEIHRQGPWFVVRERDPADRPARREEWLGWEVDLAEGWPEIERLRPAARPVLSVGGRETTAVAEAKKRALAGGYRLASTEFLMERPSGRSPSGRRDPRGARVREPGEALRVAEANRGGLISLAELTARRSRVRLYAAWEGPRPVAWVRRVSAGPADAYVANLQTLPQFRRQGLATALMSRVLADDRRAGVRRSVLVATRAGRELYLRLGYRDVGTFQVFWPRRFSPA